MQTSSDDKAQLAAARAALMRLIEADGGIRDSAVLAAIGQVPRHEFVDAGNRERAYGDFPLSIGHEQTISQPYVVALMTQALSVTGAQLGKTRVLEIGTGSGYQSAVLSLLCQHVDSIEVIPALERTARERLKRLGYHNVAVHLGDGYRGWPIGAPYDRIILTAAPPMLPVALFDQLADGGILVAPVGKLQSGLGLGDQRLGRWQKLGAELHHEDLGAVRFVPMVPAG